MTNFELYRKEITDYCIINFNYENEYTTHILNRLDIAENKGLTKLFNTLDIQLAKKYIEQDKRRISEHSIFLLMI